MNHGQLCSVLSEAFVVIHNLSQEVKYCFQLLWLPDFFSDMKVRTMYCLREFIGFEKNTPKFKFQFHHFLGRWSQPLWTSVYLSVNCMQEKLPHGTFMRNNNWTVVDAQQTINGWITWFYSYTLCSNIILITEPTVFIIFAQPSIMISTVMQQWCYRTCFFPCAKANEISYTDLGVTKVV